MSSSRPPRGAGSRVPGAHRGFTLFELMVSVTLFSLITVAIATAIRVGAHSWEAGDAASNVAHEMRLATGIIRTHLRRAYPVVIVEGGQPRLIFDGGRDQVNFVAAVPSYLGFGGPYRVTLSVVKSGRGAHLVFARQLFHLGTRAPIDEIDESVLVDDVGDVRFSYYGVKGKDDVPPAWYGDWREAVRLPALVRVSVTSGQSGAWPDIIVPLVLNESRHTVRIRRSTRDSDEDVESLDDEAEQEDALPDEEAA